MTKSRFVILRAMVIAGIMFGGIFYVSITTDEVVAWDPPEGFKVWVASSAGYAGDHANWNPATAPTTGDIVIFNGSSTYQCVWNLSVSIEAISIETGFTGTVVQAENITVERFNINVGTWTGNTTRYLTVTESIQRNTSASWTSAKTRLIMDGEDATITGSLNLYSFTVDEDATIVYGGKLAGSGKVEIRTETGNILTVAEDKTLTVGENTDMILSCASLSTFDLSNEGVIAGDGRMKFEYYVTNYMEVSFGTITCDSFIYTASGASTDKICIVGDGTNTLTSVWTYSLDTIDRLIFMVEDDQELTIDYLHIGERSVFEGGNGTITVQELTVENIGTGISYSGASPKNGTIYLENSTVYLEGSIGVQGTDGFYANHSTVIIDTIDDYPSNAIYPIYTPTYDGNNTITHPSIVRFEDAWNGYQYWMAMTPFGAGAYADDSENPSILASHNGYEWVEPPGISNPIIPKPPGTDWNNDPKLLYNDDTDELWMWYGSVIDNVQWYNLTKSSDGITWSTSEPLDFGATSVSVVKDGETFYSWQVDTDTATTLRSSTDGTNWTTIGTGTVQGTIPDDKQPWHYDIAENEQTGDYWMLLTVSDPDFGNNNLMFAYSTDGANFTLQNGYIIENTTSPRWDSRNVYKPSMLIDSNGILRVWYSGSESSSPYNWQLAYTAFSYSHVGGVPIISTDGFAAFARGAIAPDGPTNSTITLYNLEIPSGKNVLVGCDLVIGGQLIVDGLLYGPDADIIVQSSNPIPLTVNGTFYADIDVDSSLSTCTVFGADEMTGTITTEGTLVYRNDTLSFSVIPSGTITFQISHWNSTSIQWNSSGTGTTTFVLGGMVDSGYKLLRNGHVIGVDEGSTVSFTTDGYGAFEVEIWYPSQVSALIVMTVNMVGLGILVSVIAGFVIPFSRSIRKGEYRKVGHMMKDAVKCVVFIIVALGMWALLQHIVYG